MRTLQKFTCEWLARPGYAMSELAETIFKNKEISDLYEEVFDGRTREKFIDVLNKVEDAVLPFWADPANVRSAEAVTEKKAKKCLKKLRRHLAYTTDASGRLLEEDTANFFQAYIRTMIELGASLYSVGIHLRVASCVLNDLDTAASKSAANPNLQDFRTHATIKNYGKAVHLDMLDKLSRRTTTYSRGRLSLKRFLPEIPNERNEDDDDNDE